MKVIKIENYSTEYLSVEFVLGNVCNYKCHYCFPGCNEGTHRWPEHDIIMKNMKSLFSYYRSKGKTFIDLKIIGGETTLWPYLEKFVTEIKNTANIFIRISTNASRTLNYWEKNKEKLNNKQNERYYGNLESRKQYWQDNKFSCFGRLNVYLTY